MSFKFAGVNRLRYENAKFSRYDCVIESHQGPPRASGDRMIQLFTRAVWAIEVSFGERDAIALRMTATLTIDPTLQVCRFRATRTYSEVLTSVKELNMIRQQN